MPIYEYRCTSCGHTLEIIQKYNDAPLTECPKCAGPLEKLISRSAFLLKGGGWYSEGYGGGSGSGSSTTPPSSEPTTKPKPASGEPSDTTPKDGKKAASGGGCGSGSCGCH